MNPGTATLTAESYGQTVTVTVTVTDPSATVRFTLKAPGTEAITAALYDGALSDEDILSGAAKGTENERMVNTYPRSESYQLDRVSSGEYKLLLSTPGKVAPRIIPFSAQGATDLGEIVLYLYGDVDRSGAVDALDVLNLQLYIGSRAGSMASLSDGELDYALQIADVDLSASVDALDVLNLQLYIGSRAGSLAELP